MKLLKYIFLVCILFFSGCISDKTYVSTSVFHNDKVFKKPTSFTIISSKDEYNNLEYRTYAEVIINYLKGFGWNFVSSRKEADFGVGFGYGIDNGTKKIYWQTIYNYNSNSGYGSWDSFGSFGYSSGHFNYYSTPTLDAVGAKPVEYIEYKRIFILDIFDIKNNNEQIFHSISRSNGQSDSFASVSQCMIKSAFKDFPGISGETKEIIFDTSNKGCKEINPKLLWLLE